MLASRRQVLLGAVVLTAACTTERAPRPTAPDPDATLVADAIAREEALLAAYDAAPADLHMTAFRADHAAHLAALLPPTASPPPTRTPSPGVAPNPAPGTPHLAELERAAAQSHAGAATTAGTPALAQLLASLAACEASHAALL